MAWAAASSSAGLPVWKPPRPDPVVAQASRAHAVTIKLKEPLPDEVSAGIKVSLPIALELPCGCDLRGVPFQVVQSEEVLASGELPAFTGDKHDTSDITIMAPEQVGEFECRLVVPAFEIDGIAHEESGLTFPIKTRPHATSLAVWDNPSPVVIGSTFEAKVGAKCAEGCVLTGKTVEVRDEAGAVLATGVLGEAAWEGTLGLFWTPLEIAAPAALGSSFWSASFSAAELHLPHNGASGAFSFVTVLPPEHRVTVKVIEKETAAPVPNAQVRLSVFRQATDESGVASFDVPAGEHRLFIWKAGYDAPERTIDVNQSEDVQVEATALPVDNPDNYWQG
jgi:hypothetical protein